MHSAKNNDSRRRLSMKRRTTASTGRLDRSEEWSGPGVGDCANTTPPRPNGKIRRRLAPMAGSGPERDVTIRGWARRVQLRSVPGSGGNGPAREILLFRVEHYDDAGNRRPPIPVEVRSSMHTHHISGQLNEGDEVQLTGDYRKGTLRAESVLNISTGAQIDGDISTGAKWKRIAVMAAVLIIPIVAIGITANVGADLFERGRVQQEQQFEQERLRQQREFEEATARNQRDAQMKFCRSVQRNGAPLDAECRELLGAG